MTAGRSPAPTGAGGGKGAAARLDRGTRIELRARSALIVLLALLAVGVTGAVAGAEEQPAPAEPAAAPPLDCRYATTEHPSSARTVEPLQDRRLPQDDVFRPLLADPKQPRFQASYQRVRFRTPGESINAGFVGFGESFGLWGRRQQRGCDGWQVSVFGAVFSQFNLDAPSVDLINADYQVGFPLTWRHGPFSARFRLYHQSSHVGDEFILNNPGFRRINFSFEEVDGLVSMELGWFRVYGGGGYLVQREPDLHRAKIQWGVEARGQRGVRFIFGNPILVAGADFKQFEQLGWNVNATVVGGFEWFGPRATHRVRVLLNYYRGFNPYGQFFTQEIETIGIGLYFKF
ncbi:DUF1207 domain-containing protein [Candidatus Nitrospira bockiana]